VSASRVYTIARDALLLAGGLAGIAFQQVTGHTDPVLLGVYLTLIGGPGVLGLASLARAGRPETPPTAEQSSQPASPSSPS